MSSTIWALIPEQPKRSPSDMASLDSPGINTALFRLQFCYLCLYCEYPVAIGDYPPQKLRLARELFDRLDRARKNVRYIRLELSSKNIRSL